MAQIYSKYLILAVLPILIVAATRAELGPLLEHYGCSADPVNGMIFVSRKHKLKILITGVGMVNTAYITGKYHNQITGLVINAGICGAFPSHLKLGDVVNVEADLLSEMGAEDGAAFIPYEKMGLGGGNLFSSRPPGKMPFLNSLKKVRGITVNTVHGEETSIRRARKRFSPDIESMEGAAFFRACESSDAHYIQVRCVSNRVERRDRSKWKIPLAISNLNKALFQIIEEYRKSQ